jgi:hypothetical protein
MGSVRHILCTFYLGFERCLSAEMGQLMTSFRDFDTDKGWKWVRAKGPYIHTSVHEYMRFEPRGSDTYELYVLDGWQSKAGPMYALSSSCVLSV